MPRIMLATGGEFPDLSPSDQRYAEALRVLGATVAAAPWTAGLAPFAGADLVVIRSCWDYHRSLAAYRAWLDGLEAPGIAVANPPALIRWNLEKTYLDELAAAGVPVPRQFAIDRDPDALRAVFSATGWAEAVVKPAAGASGHGVTLATPASLDRLWPEIAAAAAPHRLLVQEFVPAVRESGQASFVFLGGRYSHAMRFHPSGGDFRINARFAPRLSVVDPPPAEIAAAARVLAALPLAPLYARIDMVGEGGTMVLLEVEVNEPGLLFQHVPEGAPRFAEATMAWLGRGGAT